MTYPPLREVLIEMRRLTGQPDLAFDEIHNPRDAAPICGLAVSTLQQYRRLKTGPKFYRVGGWPFYLLQDLEAFARARKKPRAEEVETDFSRSLGI